MMSTPQPATDQTRGTSLVVYGTVLHMVLALALFVLYFWIVPSSKRKFDEFGLALPWLTLNVIRLSNWVVAYWWSLVPSLALLGLADFTIIRRLAQRKRIQATVWIHCTALVLIGAAIATALAIEIPMKKPNEGPAR